MFTGIVARPVEPIPDHSTKRIDTSELKPPPASARASEARVTKSPAIPAGLALALGIVLLALGSLIGWSLYELSITANKQGATANSAPAAISREPTPQITKPTPQITHRPIKTYAPTPNPTFAPTPYPPPTPAAKPAVSVTGGRLTDGKHSHRIHFNRGSVEVVLTGSIGESELAYLMRAGAGQTLTITPTVYQGQLRPGVFEESTGQMLTPNGRGNFSYYLPSTGDYLIVLGGTPGTRYRLSIVVV